MAKDQVIFEDPVKIAAGMLPSAITIFPRNLILQEAYSREMNGDT